MSLNELKWALMNPNELERAWMSLNKSKWVQMSLNELMSMVSLFSMYYKECLPPSLR